MSKAKGNKCKELGDICSMCSWESAPLQKSDTTQQRTVLIATQCVNLPTASCVEQQTSPLCHTHASTSCTSRCYAIPWKHWDTLSLTIWCQHPSREVFRSVSTDSLFCSDPICITKREQKFWKSTSEAHNGEKLNSKKLLMTW